MSDSCGCPLNQTIPVDIDGHAIGGLVALVALFEAIRAGDQATALRVCDKLRDDNSMGVHYSAACNWLCTVDLEYQELVLNV